MKRTIVLLWSVVIISNFLFAQNTWNQKADYAGGVRTGSAGFSIGNKGYLGVGIDDFQFYHQDFWEWDQSLNVWTQKADFIGIGRTFGVAFSIGNKGYFGMGYTAFGCGCMNDFYEYDPTLNTWVQKADYPGTGRQGAVGFSIGAKGYIGMGRESNTNILKKDFYEWDQATNIWTQKTDFIGTPRFGATGFSIGTTGYVGLGNDGASTTNLTQDFYKWDQTTDSWNAIADFPGPVRYYAASFVIGSNAYVGTGFIATPPYRVVDLYEWDSQNNSWSARADFGGLPRGQAVGFSVGNRGYIGAGDISGTSADFWEYTPQISSTNCQGSQITASLANGLAAWYPFCGNPNDESGNGNDGIVHGASLTSDRFGNTNSAYQFNGISDSIRVADAPELNIRTGQSFSIALWLKQDTLNSAKYFFSKYSGSMGQGPAYAFGTQDVPNPGGGYAYFESPGGSNETRGSRFIADANWHHFVCVFNSGLNITMYLDGDTDVVSSISFSDSIVNALDISIGTGGYQTSQQFFKGKLDDIGLWNRALSVQEVQQLYNLGLCFQTITVTDTLIINANITGFNPVTYQNSIKVYPNPSNDHITIDCGSNYSTMNGYTIRIDNTLGQTVYSTSLNQQTYSVDLNTWTGN